jgi:hypothetical protein
MPKVNSIEKKVVVRVVSGTTYETVKPTSQEDRRLGLLDYKEALAHGCGMSIRSATQTVESLLTTASKEGITAVVVFLEDPHKDVTTRKTVKKKRK